MSSDGYYLKESTQSKAMSTICKLSLARGARLDDQLTGLFLSRIEYVQRADFIHPTLAGVRVCFEAWLTTHTEWLNATTDVEEK